MNTTPFMDKQIMDLTTGSSTQSQDFIDLMKPEEEEKQHHHHLEDEEEARGNGISKNDIVPSYDFQPIRPNYDSSLDFGAAFSRPWNSDSNSIKNYGSLDSIEPAKVIVEKDRSTFDATMLSEIDRTVKKHMENMLHVLEGVSARLTQLETRTQNVENSVDDLKVYVGNNHGSTDGKLRQLENILREISHIALSLCVCSSLSHRPANNNSYGGRHPLSPCCECPLVMDNQVTMAMSLDQQATVAQRSVGLLIFF